MFAAPKTKTQAMWQGGLAILVGAALWAWALLASEGGALYITGIVLGSGLVLGGILTLVFMGRLQKEDD